MTDIVSPFVPGARVARSTRYSDGYTEAFVEKVHKSGRFTLVDGHGQQWRPHYYFSTTEGVVKWSATQTGDGWRRDTVRPWDESTDAEISAANAKQARATRWLALRDRMARVKLDTLSDPMLDAIDQVLPK